MNTELLKAKMGHFFANVSPDYLINEFEKMGYTFIDSDVNWVSSGSYELLCSKDDEHDKGLLNRIFQRSRRNNSNSQKKLTSEFPGSFFFNKIVA